MSNFSHKVTLLADRQLYEYFLDPYCALGDWYIGEALGLPVFRSVTGKGDELAKEKEQPVKGRKSFKKVMVSKSC